jgi:hypothetical protein
MEASGVETMDTTVHYKTHWEDDCIHDHCVLFWPVFKAKDKDSSAVRQSQWGTMSLTLTPQPAGYRYTWWGEHHPARSCTANYNSNFTVHLELRSMRTEAECSMRLYVIDSVDRVSKQPTPQASHLTECLRQHKENIKMHTPQLIRVRN